MSAGLDAILGFGLRVPINAASLPSPPLRAETQLLQPVTGNTPLTAKRVVSRGSKQPVSVSFICVGVLTQY